MSSSNTSSNGAGRSFASIFAAVTNQKGDSARESGRLSVLIEDRINEIQLGFEAFKPPSSTSRTGMATAKTENGQKYTDSQMSLAKKLSDAVRLDEIQALKIVELLATEVDIPETIKEEHVLQAVSRYWKERSSLIALLGEIVIQAKRNEITMEQQTPISIERIQSQSVALIRKLLGQYSVKVTEVAPDYFTTTSEYLDLWIAQSLTEQSALLETMISLTCTGKDSKIDLPEAVLTTLLSTQFGKQQNYKARFKLEAVDLWEDVRLLCTTLSIAALDLDNLFEMSITEVYDSYSHIYKSPAQIQKVNNILQNAERQQELGPFILAWSSVLSANIVHRQDSGEQPEQQKFASQLAFVAMESLKVFEYLHGLFSNDLFSRDSAEGSTYKRIFFLLIEVMLLDHQPSAVKDFDGLVSCLADLLSNEEVLCQSVWQEPPTLGQGTLEVLETARGRFPLQFEPLLKLLAALATGNESSATHVVYYFHRLPTLTHLIPLSSPSIEVDVNPATGATIIRALREIELGIIPGRPFKMLPARMSGCLISGENAAHIVQWKHDTSGWSLCLTMLDAFRQTNIDGYSSTSCVELSHVKAILDLSQAAFCHPTVTTELMNFFLDGECKTSPIPILFAILDQCSRFQDPPLNLIASCLKCLTCLCDTFAQDVWLYLRQASFLPSIITTTVQFTGLDRIQTSGLSRTILTKFECTQGSYSVTLAFLDLVQVLISNAQKMELWDSKELRYLKVEVLYPCLVYFQNDIFTNYESWYFKNIRERFMIASTILSIFNDTLKDLPLLGESDSENNLCFNTLQEYLIKNFLFDGGKQLSLPLVTIIGSGPDMSAYFSKYARLRERTEVWRMVFQGLKFVKELLRHRKIIGGGPSFLEVYLIDRTVGRANASLINVLASYSDHACGSESALVSIDILSLLCALTFEWETRPSFVGYLGSSTQARKLVAMLVGRVTDDTQVPDYRIAIWSFISITITTQPGVAALFLSGDSADSETGVNGGQFKESAKSPTLIKALDIISENDIILKNEPEILPHALNFLSVLWKNAKDHAELIESLQRNDSFWKSLEIILSRSSAHTDLELVRWKEAPAQYGGNIVEQVLRVSSANADQRSRGYALRIFALAIHFHYATRSETIRDVETLPKGIKDFLLASLNQGRFTEWNKTIPVIHYQVQGHRELRELARLVSTPFDYLKLAVRRWDETYDSDYLPGESFMLDLATAKSKLVWGGESEERLLMRAILYINLNWSMVHSEMSQLSAWRFFVEVITSNLGMSVWSSKSNTGNGSWTFYHFALCLLDHIDRDTLGSIVLRTARYDCCQLLVSVIEHTAVAKRSDKKNLATYFPQIVTKLQRLIQSSDMNIVESIQRPIEGQSAHEPLLLILLFCYRALHDKDVLSSLDPSDLEGLQKSAIFLLPLISNCFSVVVESHLLGHHDHSNTIVVLLALLEELCHPVWNPHPALWIPILRNEDVFRYNLQLYARSVSSGNYENRPSFFEGSLSFLLALANVPGMAGHLCDAGVMSMFTHNGLTPLIQRGDIKHTDELHGDRGDWHQAWCMMLATVTSLLRSMGSSDAFLQILIGFIQLYGNQLSKGLETSTDQSLTSTKLEEMERTTMLFYELSKHDVRLESLGAGDTLKAFFDRSLFILQHAVHLFTHPHTLASLIVPISRSEYNLKESGRGSELTTLIEGKLAAVVRNILAAILVWIDPAVIFTKSNLEWPIRKTTIAPISNTPVYEPASIGTMFDLVQYASTSLKEWEARLEGKTGGSAGLFKDAADDDGQKGVNAMSSASTTSSKTSSKLACFGNLSASSSSAPASTSTASTSAAASASKAPSSSPASSTTRSNESAFATLSTTTGSSTRMISLLEDALVVIATQLGLYMYHPQLDSSIRRDIQDQCLDLISTLNSTRRMLQRFENVPVKARSEGLGEEAYTQIQTLRDTMIPIIKNFVESKINVQ